MPLAAELAPSAGFGPDPLGESTVLKAPGLLQKYRGRALLIASGACAINCRYCFRREFPYAEQVGNGPLSQALAAIAADSSIDEVILSGGDPLSLSDARLRALTARLGAHPAYPPPAAAHPATRGTAVTGPMPDCSSGCMSCPGRSS